MAKDASINVLQIIANAIVVISSRLLWSTTYALEVWVPIQVLDWCLQPVMNSLAAESEPHSVPIESPIIFVVLKPIVTSVTIGVSVVPKFRHKFQLHTAG